MSVRNTNVRSFEPPSTEAFDQQFWPIFMAMCVTATVLAATIVSLLDGFWMWTSLMVLPAAFAVVIFALRFLDNKRLQRSIQLAVIISLAIHCCFIIFAHQTDIFQGFFLKVSRASTPVKQPRVLHISRNVQQQPWLETNELPTPQPEEQPVIEKVAEVETATARPQPTPVETQQPTENPQLVRRQQVSRTVPRLGESLSKLSRQTQNVQPRSSEQLTPSQPAPRENTSANTASSASSQPSPRSTEVARQQSQASQTAQPTRRETENQPTRPTETQARRSDSQRARPDVTQQAASASRNRETATPTVQSATPVARSEQRADFAQKLASNAAQVQRRSTASTQRRNNVRPKTIPQSSPTAQTAQRRQRDSRVSPSISQDNPLAQARRSQVNNQPTSPQPIERPRPESRATQNQGIAQIRPQPMAVERSSNGTAGVGRSANVNRDLGSRQSSAISAADSVRRRESTTQRPDASSLTLRQAARVPRTTANQPVPSSSVTTQSLPLASRTAAEQQSQLTASSSASLTQSNSDARRANVSAARGTGNADLGPTKIVNETVNRRVEGGGQPEIQNQPSQQRMARNDPVGGSTPSISASTPDARVAANQTNDGANQLSDDSSPDAQSDIVARSGGASAISGGPTESSIEGAEPSTSTSAELAQNTIGRSDSDEDEEDDELMAQGYRMARSAVRDDGDATPNVPMDMSAPNRRQSVASSESQGSGSGDVAERAAELIAKASGGLPGSGLARATTKALAAAASSMPLMDTARRGRGDSPQPNEQLEPSRGVRRSESNGSMALSINDNPDRPSSSRAMQGSSAQTEDALQDTELSQNATAGMSLDIDARPGPAGVADSLQPDPGINSRRASRESPALQSMTETRFRKSDVGGTPSVNTAPLIAKDAFRSRNNPSRRRSAPVTEEAIERGLAFLARHQQDDGSWSLTGFDDDKNDRAKQLSSDTAATALALLAFQGAGYSHKEFKYARQMDLAVKWLIENQKTSGDLYVPMDEKSNLSCRLYSHGIAALALAEAYGMTQDEDLRQPVQRALDFIAESQDFRLGGWRYRPGDSADTSVTGWMMMAMQSGKLAGLETDDKTWSGISRWLNGAKSPDADHLFRYNPLATDTERFKRAHGRIPTPCMTSVGLLMRMYTGWNRFDPRLADGAEYLMENLPSDESINVRDTYYWYYGTQVLRHIGGEHWETWYNRLHPLLVRTQVKDGALAGSWDPLNPVPDRWGAQAGRLYVTAMNLLSLEVDYRLLPLYEETTR